MNFFKYNRIIEFALISLFIILIAALSVVGRESNKGFIFSNNSGKNITIFEIIDLQTKKPIVNSEDESTISIPNKEEVKIIIDESLLSDNVDNWGMNITFDTGENLYYDSIDFTGSKKIAIDSEMNLNYK